MDGNTRVMFIYFLTIKTIKNFILNLAKFITVSFEQRKIFSDYNVIRFNQYDACNFNTSTLVPFLA